MRRRTLAFSTVALVVGITACSNDESADEIAEMSLVEIATTAPAFADECSAPGELPPPPTGAEPTAAPETTAAETTVAATTSDTASDGTTAETTEPDADATTAADDTSGPSSTAGGASGFASPAAIRAASATTAPATTSSDSSATSGADTSAPADTSTGSTIPDTTAVPTVAPEYAEVPTVERPSPIPTTLQRTVLTEGSGPEAMPGATLSIYYVGVFSDEDVQFDTNYGTPNPLEVVLGAGGVIPGWDLGLVGARAGDRIQLDIPGDLAYGEQGNPNGGIPPNKPLSFVLDVVSIEPAAIDWPTTAPTEYSRTVIEEGPADGRAAQNFDTVTANVLLFNLVDAEAEAAAASSVPGDTAAATSATGSAAPADTAAADTTAADATVSGSTAAASTAVDGTSTATTSADGTTAGTAVETTVAETAGPNAPIELEFYEPGGVISTFTQSPEGTPLPVGPGQLGIPGLEQALVGAKPGDKFEVLIPGDLTQPADAAQALPSAGMVVYLEIYDVTGPPVIEATEPATEVTTDVIEQGFGVEAADGDQVLVNYVAATSDDGSRFASTWEEPSRLLTVGGDTFVAGFEEGLVGAQAGSQIRIDMPAESAYGSDSIPEVSLPADAALSFIVDVKAVIPADTTDDKPVDPPINIGTGTGEVVTRDITIGEGATIAGGQRVFADVQIYCASNGVAVRDTFGSGPRDELVLQQGATIQGLIDGIGGVTLPAVDPTAPAEPLIDAMRVGGSRVIYLPAASAFGASGTETLGVGPAQDLIAVVTVYGAQ